MADIWNWTTSLHLTSLPSRHGAARIAVLASIMLDEQLALLGKLGCLLSIVGSTIIVMNAPEEQEVKSIDEIAMRMETNLGR